MEWAELRRRIRRWLRQFDEPARKREPVAFVPVQVVERAPKQLGAVEIVVGAIFYMAMVGIASAWLLWRFGSLVPGLVAATLVFAAYRTLIK